MARSGRVVLRPRRWAAHDQGTPVRPRPNGSPDPQGRALPKASGLAPGHLRQPSERQRAMNMRANAHARPQKPSIPPFTGLPPLPAIEALQQHRQWVAWDYVWKDDKAKWDKPPLNPRTGGFASSS